MKLLMIVLGLGATLFLALQLWIMLRPRLQRGRPAPCLDGAYGEAISGSDRAIFYFHSPSCRMCAPMRPVIEALAADFPRIFRIDATAEPEVARAFGVMATPTTILVSGGLIDGHLLGPQPEARLRRWLQEG